MSKMESSDAASPPDESEDPEDSNMSNNQSSDASCPPVENEDPEDINERTALFRSSKTAPEDSLAYFIFFLLGIGSLLPWNAFITASAYYKARFCGTPFFVNFEAFFSVALGRRPSALRMRMPSAPSS